MAVLCQGTETSLISCRVVLVKSILNICLTEELQLLEELVSVKVQYLFLNQERIHRLTAGGRKTGVGGNKVGEAFKTQLFAEAGCDGVQGKTGAKVVDFGLLNYQSLVNVILVSSFLHNLEL